MSLINDALRRNQAKKETPTEASSGTPMQPVERSPQPGKSSAPILILLIAIVLLAAGWFFWKGFQAKPESTPTVIEAVQLPIEPETKPIIPTAANVQPAPANSEPVIAETPNQIESVAETNAAAVSQIVIPPAPPEPKLQGIFYRISNPTALIDGVTVSVGETISGARILKIDRQEVTIEQNGQTKILTIR